MRVTHEIEWKIIIFKIQPVTKTKYLLLRRYPVKLISVLDRSADRGVNQIVKSNVNKQIKC